MSRTLTPFVILLLVATGLAGCLTGDGDIVDPMEPRDRAEPRTEDLFGWILDADFDPVPAARIAVVGAAAEALTNETGFYAFERLPRQEEIIIIAEHDRFLTQSKKVLLPVEGSMRLNFTFEPRPTKVGHMQVLEFRGLLACQLVAEVHGDHLAAAGVARGAQEEDDAAKVDCGTLDANNADRWEFSVGPELAGVILEVSWEADTTLAEVFKMVVETTGFGADDAVLAAVTGPNVLRAQITSDQADRFYARGGVVRATVQVDPNLEDEEMGAGVAFAYQQEFLIHASVFYVDPPPAHYTYH